MNKICKIKAEEFIYVWKNWQHVNPRVFLDTEITDEQIETYSLMLIGGPDANRVTRQLSAELPVKLSDDQIVLAGQTFHVPDAVVQFLYPHPENSERYVYVIAADSWQGMFFAKPNVVISSMDDYMVLDGRIPNDKAGRPIEKVMLASGVFDSEWQMNTDYQQSGDEAIRAKCALRKVHPDLTTYIDGGLQLTVAQLRAYAGHYQIPNGGPRIEIVEKQGKLLGRNENNPFVELIPESETLFYISEADLQISFQRDETGLVNQLFVHQGGQTIPAEKVK